MVTSHPGVSGDHETGRFARTGDNESFAWADPTGQIRVKSGLRASGGVYTAYTYYRDVGGEWREMTGLRQNLNQRFTMEVQHEASAADGNQGGQQVC